MRSYISAAALRVKVSARISPTRMRSSVTSLRYRRVSTDVFPEPAPALTTAFVEAAIAARWSVSNCIQRTTNFVRQMPRNAHPSQLSPHV